jgi:acyl dehydratase
MSDDPVPVWGPWGPPVRVRIDHGPVWAFARAVKDRSPIYASESAAAAAGFERVPVPPTYTFVMSFLGTWPDLQPAGGTGRLSDASIEDLANRPGLALHGEQNFLYHRPPMVGDVLEGRMRTSQSWRKSGRRVMEMQLLETRWSDLGGHPVVSETTTAVYLPTDEELAG